MKTPLTSPRKGALIRWPAKALGLLTVGAVLVTFNLQPVQSDAPEISHDGLHLVKEESSTVVYRDPDADFSVYTRYMMLEPYVAFRKNWERDTRVAGRPVPKDHIAKMKTEAARLLQEVFEEELGADDGFPLATAADDDVLLMRPAIIDLDVVAPDVPTAGRSRQYTADSMAATLVLELYDSVTGDILARAIDRQVMRQQGYARLSSSVTNVADARRIYKRWATRLRDAWEDVRDHSTAVTN
jgi:hypothetical protein